LWTNFDDFFSGEMEYVPGNNKLDSDGDPDCHVDPEISKGIFTTVG